MTDAASPKIIAIDDDRFVRTALSTELRHRYDFTATESFEQAEPLLDPSAPTVVLLDINLNNESGLDLIPKIKQRHPLAEIIMLTALIDDVSIKTAINIGASDYISKPFESSDLVATIERAIHFVSQPPVSQDLSVASEPVSKTFIGRSKSVVALRKNAQKLGPQSINILIIGETGTGKEVMARLIHQEANSTSRPFIAINCAAIPENLLESTLFGHEKGAFTGATHSLPGKFELANGGDIFLDEIGSMPLALQAKLLRVLQEHEFERLGGNLPVRSKFRVIAATNRDLFDLIQEGQFRQDLYYRLTVVQLEIPPLRERREDIPLLLNEWLESPINNPHHKRLSTAARSRLTSYDWPGNARQLFNVLASMIALSEKQELTPSDIPPHATKSVQLPSPSEYSSYPEALEALRRQWVIACLEESGNNKAQAAKMMGIAKSTFFEFMRKLRLKTK